MPPVSLRRLTALMGGVAVTAGLGALAWVLAAQLRGAAPALGVDAVLLAIVVGMAVRAWWTPAPWAAPGIRFCARPVLEVAIVLLGVATDARWMLRAGAPLAAAVVAATVAAFGAGLAWGRAFGLSRDHALLVASGNAICGNSAIAAVASVTGAPREATASAVAYTALLSLLVVLGLPLAHGGLRLDDAAFGVVVGLTVYAVPQVLAAAFPVSAWAGQVGTMVKFVRVLMLVPLVLAVSLRRRRAVAGGPLRLGRLVPWYVVAFVLATASRSAGMVPDAVARVAQASSHGLTVLAMAALGLGVEWRALRAVGWRTAATATLSLATLAALALLVARWAPGVNS